MPNTRSVVEKRKRNDLASQLCYTPIALEVLKRKRESNSFAGPSLSSDTCAIQTGPQSGGTHIQGKGGQPKPRQSDASDCTALAPCFEEAQAEAPPSFDGAEHAGSIGDRELYHLPAGETKYIGNTKIPVEGWIQACRCCASWTSATVPIDGGDVPLCRRCQRKTANKSVCVDSAAEHTLLQASAGPSGKSILSQPGMPSLQQRQNLCQQALQELEKSWPELMEAEIRGLEH